MGERCMKAIQKSGAWLWALLAALLLTVLLTALALVLLKRSDILK